MSITGPVPVSCSDWNSTTINGALQNRTHNAVHELTAVNSTAMAYDVKGNLTTNTNGHTYTWDFDNRLSGADTDGNSVNGVLHEYDALGRRVRKNNGTTNTVYVLTGWQVIAEYASGAAPASPSEQYVYASYIDEPILETGTGGSVYYSRNRQYSITALTNSSGSAIEYFAYDSHGKLAIFNASASPIAASQYANPYTYTGRQFEPETGSYYFRARYFDPALGRFIARDPIGYVDGMSFYRQYFLPNGTDPYGTCSADCVCEKEPDKCYLEYAHVGATFQQAYNAVQDGPDFSLRHGYVQSYFSEYSVTLKHVEGQKTTGCTIIQDAVVYLKYSAEKDAAPDSKGDFFYINPNATFGSEKMTDRVIKTSVLNDLDESDNQTDFVTGDRYIADRPGFFAREPMMPSDPFDAKAWAAYEPYAGQITNYKFRATNFVKQAPGVKGWYETRVDFHWDNYGTSQPHGEVWIQSSDNRIKRHYEKEGSKDGEIDWWKVIKPRKI